jgi:cytochrome c553
MKALCLLALLAVAAAPVDPGRKVYTGKCARCHKLYDPAKYDDETWEKWMQKMKSKAKLNDNQYRQLSEYIATMRPPR